MSALVFASVFLRLEFFTYICYNRAITRPFTGGKMLRFKNTVCTADTSFLIEDRFTFSVLIRILAGKCSLTLLDGDRLIICHSENPYPIWIWTPDDAEVDEWNRAYTLARDEFGIEGHKFVMKHPLATYFMERARADGFSIEVDTNMLAYSCPKPIAPKRSIEGYLDIARESDMEDVASMLEGFHSDLGVSLDDMPLYIEKAKNYIQKGCFFLWNNGETRVACCTYNDFGLQCSIGTVYTRPEHRRHGYASALVHAVAEKITALGKLPTLYTDADYSASNACYTGIGFISHGGLCTLKSKG